MRKIIAVLFIVGFILSCEPGASNISFTPVPDGNDTFSEAIIVNEAGTYTDQNITINDYDYFYAETLLSGRSYMFNILKQDQSGEMINFSGFKMSVYDSDQELVDDDISIEDYTSHFLFNCTENGAYFFRLYSDSAGTTAQAYILDIFFDNNGSVNTAENYFDYVPELAGDFIDASEYIDIEWYSLYIEDAGIGSDFTIGIQTTDSSLQHSNYDYKLDLYSSTMEFMGTTAADSVNPFLHILEFTAPILDVTYYVKCRIRRNESTNSEFELIWY